MNPLLLKIYQIKGHRKIQIYEKHGLFRPSKYSPLFSNSNRTEKNKSTNKGFWKSEQFIWVYKEASWSNVENLKPLSMCQTDKK